MPLPRRLDVQGMRAGAVLVVVAFHAGLPLSGGFVGVDIFFVVSGYVITRMLREELETTGRLRVGSFYLRRFKRLTPALALVIVVTVLLSALLLSPFGVQQTTAQTGLGAIALVANLVISQVTGDYFAPAADSNPLLHTWSLSLEEQFYLLFPTVLLLAWAIGQRIRRPRLVAVLAIGALTLASLAMIRGASLGVLSPSSWLLGFYSPLTRAWEFGCGALVALAFRSAGRPPTCTTITQNRRLGSLASAAVGLAGAALVVGAVAVTDADTPFPGKATLVPVVGTALMIAGGHLGQGPVNRLLSLRPLVVVGDLSYSIYLWHWPLIVLATTLWPTSGYVGIVAAAVSFLPAVASYRWWERPIRARRVGRRRLVAVSAAVVVVPLLTATSADLVADQVWRPAFKTGRIEPSHPTSGSQRPAHPARRCEAAELEAIIGKNGSCGQSGDPGGVQVALLGDSHSEHLYAGLHESLPDLDVGVFSFRSPTMFGSRSHLNAVLDHLTSMQSLRVVIISRYWRRAGLTPDDKASLQLSLDRLRGDGRHVFVADDVPDFPFDAFQCRFRVAPVIDATRCTQPRRAFARSYRQYAGDINSVVTDVPGSMMLHTARFFCSNSDCSMTHAGKLLYGDRDHLNGSGSLFLAGRLLRRGTTFRDALPPSASS